MRETLETATKATDALLAKKQAELRNLSSHQAFLDARAKLRPAFRPDAEAAKTAVANAQSTLTKLAQGATKHQATLRNAIESVRTSGIAPVGKPPLAKVQKPMQGRGKTRRNTSTGGDIVTSLLTIRNQVKLYHWQTGSFARHKATDDLTAALDTNIDAFVESYMGRYGRPKVSGSIPLHNFSESAAKSFVAQQTTYLSKVLPKKIKSTDTDLLNLRDTILGDLTKVLYLFTLA